jgi:hypothetical protein
MVANFLLLFLVQLAVSRFRKSKAYRVFKENRPSFIYGQIINLLIAFTLPWNFVLLQVGIYDFGSKLNVGLFLGALFVSIHFPIVYFFLLVVDQR